MLSYIKSKIMKKVENKWEFEESTCYLWSNKYKECFSIIQIKMNTVIEKNEQKTQFTKKGRERAREEKEK